MSRLRRTQQDPDGGFTLVEIMIVIVIVGILATIAIPAGLAQRRKAYDSQARSDLRNTVTAMETFLLEDALQRYPVSGSTGTSQLTLQGYKKSAHASDVRMWVNTTRTAYKLSAFARSGQQWCFNSAGVTAGVIKGSITTGTVTTPPSTTQASGCT